ncbi:MAG: hypothetical protein GWN53_17380 [Gammaproteobacteria bacterium]|uniref:Uncharacterized protein n=1 Tax=Candidatus Kutchimonas denitrificans TaxID=3056748 RepID=A0AAE5CAR5_9BACT|nr:hypothetical protein [Candidatus Kutchimonas denitrificans]NIV53614.1 hypothetical protein [Gammaproteobacteria bacterium]
MDRIEVTESELLEALQEATDAEPDWGPSDAHTVRELAAAMDVDRSVVRRKLRPLIFDGQAEAVKVRRPAMDGSLRKVPAYRLLGEPGQNGEGE